MTTILPIITDLYFAGLVVGNCKWEKWKDINKSLKACVYRYNWCNENMFYCSIRVTACKAGFKGYLKYLSEPIVKIKLLQDYTLNRIL